MVRKNPVKKQNYKTTLIMFVTIVMAAGKAWYNDGNAN